MYQALYRKYRPRSFDDVVGQEQVTQTLKSQVASDRTSHAYLFIGVRGTGKTTCAKILAKAVNCESPENGNPCNKCASCLGIESGGVMDVVEIDAASNNGVENVRALREEAVYSPASVKKRVYIIDEVHMLSTAAFNALLKILEEPPPHLVFILATTEVHKVLPTIMSRCQRYSFKRIAPDAIAERLKYVAEREGIALEDDAAALLARLADGSMRDALSLLDQCAGQERVTTQRVLSAMGLAGNFQIARLVELIAKGDTAAALEQFESLWRDGKSPATLLSEATALLRDLMMLAVAPKGGRQLISGGFDDETLSALGKAISTGAALEYISVIQETIGRLRDGRDPKIEAELCIIGLCEPKLLDTPERLALRIAKLEEALENGAAPQPGIDWRHIEPMPMPTVEPIVAKTSEETDEQPVAEKTPEAENPPIADNAHETERSPASESISESESAPDEAAVLETPVSQQDTNGNLWPELFAELKRVMPPFHLAHLSGAQGGMENGALVITVKNAFAKAALEKPEPSGIIRAALEKTAGAGVRFEFAEGAPDASSKLDELARFDNVNFE